MKIEDDLSNCRTDSSHELEQKFQPFFVGPDPVELG